MRTSWESRFHDRSGHTKQIVDWKTSWTRASNFHIHHKADPVALQLGEWWAGRWGQAVLLQNQGGPTHTTQLGVPIVQFSVQLHWAPDAGHQDCVTSVSPLCLTQCLIQGRGSDQWTWLKMKILTHLSDRIWSNGKKDKMGNEEGRKVPTKWEVKIKSLHRTCILC